MKRNGGWNEVLDCKMKDERVGDGCRIRINCLMHSPYSLFIAPIQSPSFSLPHPHSGQLQDSKGWEKRDFCGKQRKIEHPALLYQSVSSIEHCSVSHSLRVMQRPFYLTWLCKRFSLRPKEGECWGLDKIPWLPDGALLQGGRAGVEGWRGKPTVCTDYLRGELWV